MKREWIRAANLGALLRLENFIRAVSNRYVPLTTPAMDEAARLGGRSEPQRADRKQRRARQRRDYRGAGVRVVRGKRRTGGEYGGGDDECFGPVPLRGRFGKRPASRDVAGYCPVSLPPRPRLRMLLAHRLTALPVDADTSRRLQSGHARHWRRLRRFL